MTPENLRKMIDDGTHLPWWYAEKFLDLWLAADKFVNQTYARDYDDLFNDLEKALTALRGEE